MIWQPLRFKPLYFARHPCSLRFKRSRSYARGDFCRIDGFRSELEFMKTVSAGEFEGDGRAAFRFGNTAEQDKRRRTLDEG